MLNKKVILITGSLGFIFSSFVRQTVARFPEYRFVGVDKAVKEYNLNNSFKHPNYTFYLGDIADAHFINNVFTLEKPSIVIGAASETHVDFSIDDVLPFIKTNVVGTQTVINACLKHSVERYVHISTDEIFGQKLSRQDPGWTEDEPILARNPYSASKGCAELITIAAHNTHGLQYNITRSCNVFGPRQKNENLIPHIIKSLMNDQEIKIHGDGSNFRQWIYVDDKISAIMQIIKHGHVNQVYNVGDENFTTNLEMVEMIAEIMNKIPKIKFIQDRKAHDFGYRVNTAKLQGIGWKPKNNFKEAVSKTIEWYLK